MHDLTDDDVRRYYAAVDETADQRVCASCDRWFSDPDLFGHTITMARGKSYCWECAPNHAPSVRVAVRHGFVNGAHVTITEGYAEPRGS